MKSITQGARKSRTVKLAQARETPQDRTERAQREASLVTAAVEALNGAGDLDADVDLVKLMRASRGGLTRKLRKLRANLKRMANEAQQEKIKAAKKAKKKAAPAPFPNVPGAVQVSP